MHIDHSCIINGNHERSNKHKRHYIEGVKGVCVEFAKVNYHYHKLPILIISRVLDYFVIVYREGILLTNRYDHPVFGKNAHKELNNSYWECLLLLHVQWTTP